MPSISKPSVVLAAIAICAAAALYSLSFRYRAEAENRAVALVAEADMVEALAAQDGTNIEQALRMLSAHGLGGVVITEQTIGELESGGAIEIHSTALATSRSPIVLIDGDFDAVQMVEMALKRRFDLQPSQLTVRAIGQSSIGLTITNFSPSLIRSVSVGLDPQYVIAAKLAGLEIIARHANPPGSSARTVRETIKASAEAGARYFLPSGEQVLGRRGNRAALVAALAEFRVTYCAPEFAKIGGDANVVSASPDGIVRLHAAQAAEIDKLTEAGYVERYAKAASERNVRVLLLRPLDLSAQDPLLSFGHMIEVVKAKLQAEGLKMAPAHPFRDPQAPRWIAVVIGLSLIPIAAFVASLFGGSVAIWIGVAVSAALAFGAGLESIKPLTALLATIALPLSGFGLIDSMPRHPIVRFLLITLTSVVGGLAAAGLLNSVGFMVQADQFTGVKAAVFVPVVLVGLLFLRRVPESGRVWTSPVFWSHAVLGIVIIAALAFMIARTGNDNPAGVSGIELQVRSILERILVVRPRTKEFLIGHPALIVGLFLYLRCQAEPSFKSKWMGWTALLLMVGAIGQTSVVNTLCHFHTPLLVGLTRILIGAVIGGIIGWVLWLAARPLVFETGASRKLV